MAAQTTGQIEADPALHSNINRTIAIVSLLPHLATKTDIAHLRTDIESLRSEIKTLRWLIVLAVLITGVVVQYLNQGGA